MKRKAFVAVCFVALLCHGVFANNIATSNVKLINQNTGAHTTQVQFDITWDNSWRTSSGPANWDAAWVFVKYRVNAGAWRQASLNNGGSVAPAGSTINVGLVNPGAGFSATTNPGVGAFVYRSSNGSGTFTVTAAQLQWNYGVNGVGNNDLVDVQVYAIEEVYVPQGSFVVGSGAGSQPSGEYGSFYKYPNESDPFPITSEAVITVGSNTDNLFYNPSFNDLYVGDKIGPIPAAFPKGFRAFYCMKYELSQQGYADFLNNINFADSRAHWYVENVVAGYRYQIDTTYGNSTLIARLPYVACNFISWGDLGAYLAWAGLRPMTELEFEKACRGTLPAVPNELAWGTNAAAKNYYLINNLGATNEIITSRLQTYSGVGNASSFETNLYGGPFRVGIFAASAAGLPNAGRVMAGATYYGIMEMSGNVFERAVSVGNPEGRAFTGTHGNGELGPDGFPTNTDWPSSTTAAGIGQRGGGFTGSSSLTGDSLTVSGRRFAAKINPTRSPFCGGRGVRTAP